ncbi:hypothetical protein AB1Y20_012887 [Prymnesium parvum]|uniref:Nuclear protein MDM1 n=1 Tax=Prymnesium parvum TaxID=97485 RepID=A0AB34IML6_PRYPA
MAADYTPSAMTPALSTPPVCSAPSVASRDSFASRESLSQPHLSVRRTISEPASWAESLAQYSHEKKCRPRPDEEYQKPHRVTNFDKKREETRYHPILQTFTQPEREASARSFEATAQIASLNKARDRQLATESAFNILTMEDKRHPRQPKQPVASAVPKPFNPHAERPTFRHPLDSCYTFNIISNLSLNEHHYAPPAARPRGDAGNAEPKPRLQHKAALPRDFNILSNKYREEHEDKMLLEREVQRRTAARKYWETHDYDPLTGRYLDAHKEQAYVKTIEDELTKQPMKQYNRLPPSLQKGEGHVYDITTHVIKNKDLYDRKQAAEQAWFDSYSSSWIRDEEARHRSAQRQQLDDQRSINRAAHERYMESYQYGYNIVDQRDYRNPETYMPPPLTKPKRTLWETVGTNRPPNPPPLPAPPPMPAPLLSTIPSGVRTGGFNRASTSCETRTPSSC